MLTDFVDDKKSLFLWREYGRNGLVGQGKSDRRILWLKCYGSDESEVDF